MSQTPAPFTLDISTPEQLAAMLEGRDDAEINDAVRTLGSDAVLDKVFASMVERFVPERAQGARAVIQWNLQTPQGVQAFQVQVEPSRCTVAKGGSLPARVTIDASIPVFLRVIAGRVNGLQAFSSGQLRVSGEQVLALSQQLWFDVDLSQAPLDISRPSELAQLIAGRSDEEIEAGIAATGTQAALLQVFEGMVEHYLPEEGPRKRTVVEFSIRTPDGDRVYQFVADAQRCSYHLGSRESANVTLLLRFTTFLRMACGELDGILALAHGRLKVRGNILLARKLQSWFDLEA